MKQVSQKYLSLQKSNVLKPVRKIELFRRLLLPFSWDEQAIDITNEIISMDRLSWKLDSESLNEFKASNIRLEVENTNGQWFRDSSRFNNFLLYQSKIKICLGLEDEIFPCWLGYIDEVVIDSHKPSVILEVKSIEQLLEITKASDSAIHINNELVGIGDGIKSEFELLEFPVGDVSEVRVGNEVLRPGTRWRVENLDSPFQKAVIKFDTIQPEPGQEVRVDYLVWKRNKQIHEIADDVITNTAPYLSKQIEPVEFEPPAEREIIHNYITDFENYFLHNAKIIPDEEPPKNDGQITIDGFDTEDRWKSAFEVNRINFKRIPNGITPLWTSQYEGLYEPGLEKAKIESDYTFPWVEVLPTGSTATLTDGVRTITHNGGADYLLYDQKEEFVNSRCIVARMKFNSLNGRVTLGTRISQSPYYGAQIEFVNMNQIRVRTSYLTSSINVNLSVFHTFMLALDFTGTPRWFLYIDGSQVSSGNLGALSGGTSGVTLQSTTTSNNTFSIDYIRFNGIAPTPANGELTIKIDYGKELSGLSTFSLINTLGPFFAEIQGLSTGVNFYYSWSPDDINYSAEIQLQNGANIGNWNNTQSPRFIKFRIHLTDTLESNVSGIKKLWLPAIATSNAIDGGSGIYSWDTWHAITLNNDGNIQRFTASSTALTPSGFGFHRSVGSDDLVLTDEFQQSQGSGIPQKMHFITLLNTSGPKPPLYKAGIFKLKTKNIMVTMANYGDMSVMDVLKELAKLANYEIGIDGNGTFFFRNKKKGQTPILTLDDSNVISVENVSYGYEQIYNTIYANFGNFRKIIDSITENEPSPASIERFGVRKLSIDGGRLMYESDVDLATAMAKRYFSNYNEPKHRLTITSRFMPELDLGDIVHVNLKIADRKLLPEFNAKIVGISHEIMGSKTELELLEL